MLLSYDLTKMKELMNSFHILSKIRIVVFNDQFEPVAAVPDHNSALCTLIRTDQIAKERCRQSNSFACAQCRRQNGPYSYTCHAGLRETVVPIYSGNFAVGYIMFGQVLQCVDKEQYWEELSRRCASYQIDMDLLKETYALTQPIQPSHLHASAQLLEACAGFLCLQKYISLEEDSLPKRIDQYISNNLTGAISVPALCQHFEISRSRLYKIANEHYGCGIEQLTRRLRINLSKNLLKTTSLSVSHIAYRSGYPDYNYFIKVFKKEVGITPLRYRKGVEQD